MFALLRQLKNMTMLNGPPGGDVIHEEVDVNGHHACLEGHAYPSATEDGFEAGPCPDNFTFTVGHVLVPGP